jgi:RecA/RadA recombinase
MELEGSKIVLETAAATLDVTLVAGLTGETVKELFGEIATTKALSAGVAAVLAGVTATGP